MRRTIHIRNCYVLPASGSSEDSDMHDDTFIR